MARFADLFISRKRVVRRTLAAADSARDRGQWAQAADCYGQALKLDPTRAAVHVQYGHALKESGRPAAAETAYRAAIALDTANADTWLQLGHVLKMQGVIPEAVEAYRQSLLRDPHFLPAKRELVGLGARDLIPDGALDHFDSSVVPAVSTLREATKRLEDALHLTAYPSRSYNEFRHAFPVLAPPATPIARIKPLLVEIDARGCEAAEIRVTVDSLLEQVDQSWLASVLVDEEMLSHPVASMERVDRRIAFRIQPAAETLADYILFLPAGTFLDRHALSWFIYCQLETNCAAAYADHDYAEESWKGPREHFAPVLHPRFDIHWFETGLTPPTAILVRSEFAAHARGRNYGRALCAIAGEDSHIVHIPRLLTTVVDVVAPVRDAPADPPRSTATVVDMRNVVGSGQAIRAAADRISVIVPTHNQPKLITQAVSTLLETAASPANIEVIVVDHRNDEPDAQAALNLLAARENVRILPFDQPFNWSHINNIAIEQARGDRLVLMNDDTEMLVQGWDSIVLEDLAKPHVGIVGARLLYPDRTLQHAGIVFGLNGGPPMHEGVGAPETDGGPCGRWLRQRSVAAVTGAFMAMSRQAWQETGGFDDLQLPLAYNDVDMCFKVRALGLSVLYEPRLVLIHHESRTRGMNSTRARVAFDRAELRVLYAHWGDALFHDPTINPHWSPHGRPFDSFREPSLSEVLDYVRSDPPSHIGKPVKKVSAATVHRSSNFRAKDLETVQPLRGRT